MSKSKKLKLTKIELQTKDGKKVDLSLAEAKELHEQLHELFGEKVVRVPGSPVIIDRYRDRYWNRPYVTWCSTGGSISNSAAVAKTDNLQLTYTCQAA